MIVNVVIVGHVDHGKSTLIGRLLYDSEALPEDKLFEIQKLLEEYKRTFEFAYFIDSFKEELDEERTIDTTRLLFKGRNYYTIVDVPGHKEFIKNMLTGACHAEVAILVVSAPDGVQEQTRRHAFLTHMLGIKECIVCLNKMDLVDYQQGEFERVKRETTQLLSSLGYYESKFIPVSATEGDNVYQPSERMEWYRGSTLLQALDRIEPEEMSVKPLRFVVQDAYLVGSEKVTVGRVESGKLKEGDKLIFHPSGVKSKVNKIKGLAGEMAEANPGDSIGLIVGDELKRGDVGGHLENPPNSVNGFLGQMVLLEGTVKRGETLEIKCGTKRAKCRVQEISEKISSETGEVIGKNVAGFEKNEAATIIFRTEPLVVEEFSEIPELGRFVVAREGSNIGVGFVLETSI